MPLQPIEPFVLQQYRSTNPVDMDWIGRQVDRISKMQSDAQDRALQAELAMSTASPLARDRKVYEEILNSAKPTIEGLATSDLSPGQMQFESQRVAREVARGMAPIEARSMKAAEVREEFAKTLPGDMVDLAMADWEQNSLGDLTPGGPAFGGMDPTPRRYSKSVNVRDVIDKYVSDVEPETWNAIFADGQFNAQAAAQHFGEGSVVEAMKRAGIDANNAGRINKFQVEQLTADMVREAAWHAVNNDPEARAHLGDRVYLELSTNLAQRSQEFDVYRQGLVAEVEADLNEGRITPEQAAQDMELIEGISIEQYLTKELAQEQVENAVMSKARTNVAVSTLPASRRPDAGADDKGAGAFGDIAGQIEMPGRTSSLFPGGDGEHEFYKWRNFQHGRGPAIGGVTEEKLKSDPVLKARHDRSIRLLDMHHDSFIEENESALQDMAMDFSTPEHRVTKRMLAEALKDPKGLYNEDSPGTHLPGWRNDLDVNFETYDPRYYQKPFQHLTKAQQRAFKAEQDRYISELDNLSADGTVWAITPDKAINTSNQAGYNLMSRVAETLVPVASNEEAQTAGIDFFGMFDNSLVGTEADDLPDEIRKWIDGDKDTGGAQVTHIKEPGEYLPAEIRMRNPETKQEHIFQFKPGTPVETIQDVMEFFGHPAAAANAAWYDPKISSQMETQGYFDIPQTKNSAQASPARVRQIPKSGHVSLEMSGGIGVDNSMGYKVMSSGAVGEEEKAQVQNLVYTNFKRALAKEAPDTAMGLTEEALRSYIVAFHSPEGQAKIAEAEKAWPGIGAALRKASSKPLEFTQRGQAVRFERILRNLIFSAG
jgi:hypothetical protein